MINIKTPAEIAIIKEGGQKLSAILDELLARSKAGVTTAEIDSLAEKMILEVGGVPAFKNYKDNPEDTPYPSTICASVNEQLVHTPASDYVLKDGDIFTIDIGMKYPASGRGFFTDMAKTIAIGEVPEITKQLLAVTKKSLELGIAQVKPGNFVHDIARAVQDCIESAGFSVVRQLVGHGVGYEVHEEPRIPNFVDRRHDKVKLKEGMVLAIEPMVNIGDYSVTTLDDNWTIVPTDNSLSAHFEHTIAVTKDGVEILTQ